MLKVPCYLIQFKKLFYIGILYEFLILYVDRLLLIKCGINHCEPL